MKLPIKVTLPCVYVGGKSKEYEFEGRKGMRYTIAVVCDGESVNLPCTADVFDIARDMDMFTALTLFGQLDTSYNKFLITSLDLDFGVVEEDK